MDASDFNRATRDYITDYIKFADAKAGAVVSLVALLAGATAFGVKDFFVALRAAPVQWLLAGSALGCVVAIAAVMTLWHGIDALAPRTSEASHSLASFPDIAAMSEDQYIAAAAVITSDAIARQIAKHSATLARVAALKYAALIRAIWWLRILLFGVYAVVIIYAAKLLST